MESISNSRKIPTDDVICDVTTCHRERVIVVEGQRARVLPKYKMEKNSHKNHSPSSTVFRDSGTMLQDRGRHPLECNESDETDPLIDIRFSPIPEEQLASKIDTVISGEPPEVVISGGNSGGNSIKKFVSLCRHANIRTGSDLHNRQRQQESTYSNPRNFKKSRDADDKRSRIIGRKSEDELILLCKTTSENNSISKDVSTDLTISSERNESAGGGLDDGDGAGKTGREKCYDCFRQFIAFLFSTIGSCCLLVGYTIMGGFLFQYIESANEINMKIDMQLTRMQFVARLWNVTEAMNILYEQNWTLEADAILKEFTKQVYVRTKMKGWDADGNSDELQWSFPGSLLYSITVVTTIGYGHIAPKTNPGKVVTIIYAIFGIPLTLFTITNLGRIMATAFRVIYKYIICGLFCICCSNRKRSRRHRRHRRQRKLGKRHGPSSDSSAGTPLDPAAVDNDLSDPEDSVKERLRALFKVKVEISKISVPIYVSLLLMMGYIALGSLVFKLSEDWDTLICLYFCFITLSTIGFGDYVPGTTPDKLGSQGMMVLCALYLVFGLALIAMCFDLIQEEARNKFRRLGRKLGLLDKEGDS